MNHLPPSLPSLGRLPYNLALDCCLGYIYSKISRANPYLMVTICAIRATAHTIFYYLLNAILKGKDLKSQKIFLLTTSIVNGIFFIALREFNLIGGLFACLLGLGMIGHLGSRILYIQLEERRILGG